jgi:hypothetical protein
MRMKRFRAIPDRASRYEKKMDTAMSSHRSARDTAEAKFAAKLMRHQEARRAMSEYEADNRRIDERTARLRELRLAKEAADAATHAAAKPSSRRKHPDR